MKTRPSAPPASLRLCGLIFALCLGAPALRAAGPARDLASLRRSTEPISIISPAPDEVLPNIRGRWVMGSVSDPKARFEINGQAIDVHPGGGFLAWLPVQPGTFTFDCTLATNGSTETYRRTVFVSSPPAPLPAEPLAIDGGSLWPSGNMDLRPGDWILARMRASPGQKARFRLKGGPWTDMREVDPALGVYEAAAVVKPGRSEAPAPVEYKLGSGWRSVEARSAGTISIDPGTLSIATVKEHNPVNIYSHPNEGPFLQAHPGTSLVIDGRAGEFSRVALSAGQTGWVESRHLEPQPAGARPPRSTTDTVGIRDNDDGISVRIGLTERVPFSVEESEDLRSLTARLHYTSVRTNWIVYASTENVVREVRVKQETGGITAVTIHLVPGKTLWGYHAEYNGSALKIDVRPAPALARPPASPLAGLRVILDPGHMPSAPGRLGPLGTTELEANYAIAKAVEALLLKQGAKPVVTRSSADDEVGLAERAKIAWENKGDLFVSIHNNGLNEAENPFLSVHGYQIFYYHTHSLGLAHAIYRSYQKSADLRDERLRFGDYLVLRITEMPSVLTESAYMNYPDQEAMLADPSYQAKLAKTIVTGIQSFLEEERSRQGAPQKAQMTTIRRPNASRRKP